MNVAFDVGVVASEYIDLCGAPMLLVYQQLKYKERFLLLPLNKRMETLEMLFLGYAGVVHDIVVADVDPGTSGSLFGSVCFW